VQPVLRNGVEFGECRRRIALRAGFKLCAETRGIRDEKATRSKFPERASIMASDDGKALGGTASVDSGKVGMAG